MKINFLGLTISISRPKKGSTFSINDVKSINDQNIENLKKLSSYDLKARQREITVDRLESKEDLTNAKDILKKYGIVIIPNFLDSEKANKFSKKLYAAYQDKATTLSGDHQEDQDALIQNGGAKISGYRNLAEYPKPIVQIRQGQDHGMVDIFNADQLVPNLAKDIRQPFENSLVLPLLQDEESNLAPQNLNCYINQSIQNTRGFHADSYSQKLKGFIYLTDVTSLDDGPYTYVKGSHVESPYRRANQKLSDGLPNKTEAPLVDQEAIVPILAPRGSLVISDQGGFHRGFPQSPSGCRIIAVMNYV